MEPSADSPPSEQPAPTEIPTSDASNPPSPEEPRSDSPAAAPAQAAATTPESSGSASVEGSGGKGGTVSKTVVAVDTPAKKTPAELKEADELKTFMNSFWYKRFPKKCLKCWRRCWKAQRVASLLLAFIFLGLDVVDMIADILVTAEASNSEPAWKTALVIACFQGAVCLMASFYSTIRGAFIFFGCIKTENKFASIIDNADASLFWKNMVKIIPVATEDFLSSYAIVGLNAQSGNESLTFFQAASLLLAGLKCLMIGVTSGWIAITSPKHCRFFNLFLTIFGFLECAVCFVMGGILIFLAVVQDISGEYRFIFLAATLFGWASSFSLIYTSFALRKVFTMDMKKAKKKVEPWKMPSFYVFLLFPGLAVPIIEEYSPEFLFKREKSAKNRKLGGADDARW